MNDELVTPRMTVRVVVSALALLLASSHGCVTESIETSNGQLPPVEPRRVAPAPTASPINAISLLKAQRATDTTGNGYENRLDVAVYLFSRPYPVPRHADGSLVFSYYRIETVDPISRNGGDLLARWTFDRDAMQYFAIKDLIGPGYALALDLSTIGLTELPVKAVDLTVEFVPTDGRSPVRATSIQRVPLATF